MRGLPEPLFPGAIFPFCHDALGNLDLMNPNFVFYRYQETDTIISPDSVIPSQ